MKKILINQIEEKVTDMFSNKGAVLVCGDKENYNGLAIGWGMMGTLWSKNVVSVFIKPTRYTFSFANNYDNFSIMWFNDDINKTVINAYGTKSGRDVNKEKIMNFHPQILDDCIVFNEARLIITCKKILQIDLKNGNIHDEKSYNRYYEKDDCVHWQYICEILGVYCNDEELKNENK